MTPVVVLVKLRFSCILKCRSTTQDITCKQQVRPFDKVSCIFYEREHFFLVSFDVLSKKLPTLPVPRFFLNIATVASYTYQSVARLGPHVHWPLKQLLVMS